VAGAPFPTEDIARSLMPWVIVPSDRDLGIWVMSDTLHPAYSWFCDDQTKAGYTVNAWRAKALNAGLREDDHMESG
jgi:hypothetical protein